MTFPWKYNRKPEKKTKKIFFWNLAWNFPIHYNGSVQEMRWFALGKNQVFLKLNFDLSRNKYLATQRVRFNFKLQKNDEIKEKQQLKLHNFYQEFFKNFQSKSYITNVRIS